MLFLSSVAAVVAVVASAGTAIILADAAHRGLSEARGAAREAALSVPLRGLLQL